MTFSNIRTTAFAVLITSCSAVSGSLLGATVPAATAPTITYTASGTFASPAANGNDTLKLAGEPFSVTIAVSAATKPVKTGRNWALYTKLKLTGTVHSGLLGPSPISITSGAASVQQFIDPGQPDLFVMAAPLKVVGISLTIKANITLPAGTLSKPLLQPFKAVTLTAADATMVYADGTANTTLASPPAPSLRSPPVAPRSRPQPANRISCYCIRAPSRPSRCMPMAPKRWPRPSLSRSIWASYPTQLL